MGLSVFFAKLPFSLQRYDIVMDVNVFEIAICQKKYKRFRLFGICFNFFLFFLKKYFYPILLNAHLTTFVLIVRAVSFSLAIPMKIPSRHAMCI